MRVVMSSSPDWSENFLPHRLVLSDYRGIAKWFGAHYNQEALFQQLKVRKDPLALIDTKWVHSKFKNVRMHSYHSNQITRQRSANKDASFIWNSDILKHSYILKLRVNRKGPGCPSGYDAGITNQTPLVQFPSPLKFFLSLCDSNQVRKWFGTHYNLEVPLQH